MGFGSETITTVGSSAYNLAGEPENRGNFLKNNLIGSVMSGQANRDGLGNSIFMAHFYGPRTDLISYAKWADYSGYADQVGFPRGFTYQGVRVDSTSFAMLKDSEPDKKNEFLYGHAGPLNYQYFAYWYLGEYAPGRISEAFTVRPETVTTGPPFNRETVLTGNLILKFTGTSEEIIFTPPVDIKIPGAVYAYHFYHTSGGGPGESTDSGWINVASEADFPSVDGYSLDAASSSNEVKEFDLIKTVTTNISYSDGTPSSETTNTTTSTSVRENYLKIYKKIEVSPATGSSGSYEKTWKVFLKCTWTKITLPPVIQTTETEISPGVFKTTTTTTVEDVLIVSYAYRNTYSKVLTENWGNERVLIYRKGDNPTVDDYIFGDFDRDTGLYLPIIPLRLHNRAVNKTNYPAQYALNRKAARKAFKRAKIIDTLLKNLESNEQIDQIDHAWVVFGSSLGSKEQDALNYNYQFMKDWVEGTPYDPLNIKDPFEYAAALEEYWEALEAYENYSSGSEGGTPIRPPKPIPPKVATYKFQTYLVKGGSQIFGYKPIIETPWAYNIMLAASGGAIRTGNGYHAKSKDRSGNCWVYQQGNVTIKTRVLVGGGEGGEQWEYKYTPIPVIVLGKQLTSSAWEEYVFFDVNHTNYVYGGLSVITSADKALEEGEKSSFLFPMSHQVLKNMQLIEGTQLAMASSYLVINYYDKQKIPWYATGIFQIVIVVVVIVIAVYTGYVSGESLGVLGSNAMVGGFIGFTGTAAIIAGAIVNALAAAIISAVITKLSIAVLGDKIGAIVGAVLSMVVVWGMTNSWNFNTTDLVHSFTRADNLLKMTLSGADLTSKYMQASAQEIIADTQSLLEDYKDKATELAAMTQQYLGSNGIDPTVIAEATRNLVESPEDFMSRTLMTGDDIADISLSLIERFPESQLKLPYT